MNYDRLVNSLLYVKSWLNTIKYTNTNFLQFSNLTGISIVEIHPRRTYWCQEKTLGAANDSDYSFLRDTYEEAEPTQLLDFSNSKLLLVV